MCVIVDLKSDSDLSREDFDLMYSRNADGIGFAYRHKTKKEIRVEKYILSREDAWKKFISVRKSVKTDIIFHLRNSNTGNISVENCHPFSISSTCAMAHNGTLTIPLLREGKSDTWHFAEYLKVLTNNGTEIQKWLETKELSDSIASSIDYNRLAFITLDGIYTFGHWDTHRGVRYSNTNWLPTKEIDLQSWWDRIHGYY